MEWSGFHKKSVEERRQHLRLKFPNLFHNAADGWPLDRKLPIAVADNMIENCIGTVSLPLGLAVGLSMNGRRYVVPMAAEEPSIVAGCCLVCTRIVEEFTASSSNEQGNIVIAQLLLESPDDDKTCFQQETFNSRIRPSLIETCNGQLLTGLRARGARGVVDLVMHTKTGDRLAWLNIHVDVGDINGANTVTRLAEQLAPFVEQSLPGCRCLVKICSNLCAPQRTATAEFRVPVERLATGDLSGAEVCRRIVEANRWASIDPYRAVTHNKGIMNGVDAVAVATGQDWRSIEAACHAYACGAHNPSYQQYRALTDYWVDEENAVGNSKRRFLCARLTLPLAVAAAGGACRSNDSYRYSMGLMDFPDSCQLAQIMTCIGLACNLAALRALVTEGLITGHMKLHAKNIALAAGAPPQTVQEVVDWMLAVDRVDLQTATAYLDARHIHRHLFTVPSADDQHSTGQLNIFLFEAQEQQQQQHYRRRIVLNVAFGALQRNTQPPIMLELSKRTWSSKSQRTTTADNNSTLVSAILGGDKSYEWILSLISLTDRLQAVLERGTIAQQTIASLMDQKRTLVVLFILINCMLRRLIRFHPDRIERFIAGTGCLAQSQLTTEQLQTYCECSGSVAAALSLLHALYQSIRFRLEQAVMDGAQVELALGVIRRFIQAVVDSPKLMQTADDYFSAGTRWGGLEVVLVLLLIDPSVESTNKGFFKSLELANQLGQALNYELGAWHDLARLDRDLTDRRRLNLNTVQIWFSNVAESNSFFDDRQALRERYLQATVYNEQRLDRLNGLIEQLSGDPLLCTVYQDLIDDIRQSIQLLYCA